MYSILFWLGVAVVLFLAFALGWTFGHYKGKIYGYNKAYKELEAYYNG